MSPTDIRKLADDCDYPDWEPRISATLRACADVFECARCMDNDLISINALANAISRLEGIKP